MEARRVAIEESLYPSTIGRKFAILALAGVSLVAACAGSSDQPSEDNTEENAVAVVDLLATQQAIRGFGGANILPWRPDMTVDEAHKAFGSGPGQLGFTILRLRVPLAQSEFAAQIPTARLAHSLGAVIIASPWSPPEAMKTNRNPVGGELRSDSYEAYAAHLKAFADYMSSNGAPLYAISVQNEPDVTVDYESCYWNAAQMLAFVKNNAPSIGIDVFADESSAFQHNITDAILNDPAAAANLPIIAGHIYGAPIAPYPLALSKGKEVWMTEHLDLDASWNGALSTGKEISDCMNASMSAYLWWYIVRYYGPILEDGSISKRGYVMSQYARFVRPGYFRISATVSPQSLVDVSAYRSGSRVVIVAINRNSSAVNQTFAIENGVVATFTPYTTSIAKNCRQEAAIAMSNGRLDVTLDPSSVTTFVSS
jgi:glucuronoarabinoxylan endo-1,4-beta-xylanase